MTELAEVITEEYLSDELVEKIAGETESRFDFDAEFQRKVASLAIRDTSFMRRTDGLIEPQHFDSVSQAILYQIALTYFRDYKMLPSDVTVWAELIKDASKKRLVRAELMPDVIAEFKTLRKESIGDKEFVIGKVSEFARNQAIERSLLESVNLLEKRDFAKMQESMAKAFRVGAMSEAVGLDFWDDIDRRTQHRKDEVAGLIKPNSIPTGYSKLNNLLYHKGWGRRELTAFLGAAKAGKSTILGDLALKSSLQGYNTLYVSLEVAGNIIAERMDANVSHTSMDELKAKISEVKTKLDSAKSRLKVGKMMLHEYPTGSLKGSDLRRLLENYLAQGVKFDMVVVDYADIMSPEVYTSSPIENSKQVWIDLRAISQEYDVAMLTATQANRDALKNETTKAENVAEDYNKVRIADLLISLNSTEEEKARGEARLFFAASRNQRGEFSIRVKQDLSQMRFISEIMEIH